MLKKCAVAALVNLLVATTVLAQDARTAVTNASKAIGVDSLRSVQYTGSGYDFAFGQAFSPMSPWPKFTVKSYTRSIDFERSASQATRLRAQFENPPRGGGQQPLAGEQTQNQTIIVGPNTPWTQQLEIVVTPHGFLRAAAAKPATARTQSVGGKRFTVITFTGDNKAQVNGYINDQNLLERVETWIDNPMLGDMPYESLYSDYKDYNGVKFPSHIVQNQGGWPLLDLTVNDVKPNAAAAIQPQAGAGGGAPPANAPIPTEKIADGVYLIRGAGAISLAFDFKDYAVVMEGPGDEARGEAVIAETKKLIPNKPIRYLINTHHHFDHSSGLRPFVAEGATIVTHQVNKSWFEKVLANPRTLSPDRLQQSKKKVIVEAVDDKRVLTDGNQVIELYHIRGNMHNAGLLFAYLPKQKILIQADMLGVPMPNAPMQVNSYGENFLMNLDRLKLDVAMMVPIHLPATAKPVAWADVMKSVGRNR
jgi:glyoxylase-like metal-dependent hydrolase (beta-lactamase superfamily II)